MPIYEFSCAKCGQDFEEITTKDTAVCPHCGSHDTKKIMSACARRPTRGGDGAPMAGGGGGCASCSGGNCASCGH